MCYNCDLDDEVLVDSGEVVDTYGGDYTYRDTYYCPSTDTFWFRDTGAKPEEGSCNESENEYLRVTFRGEK